MRQLRLSNTILIITMLIGFGLCLTACGGPATPPPLAVTDKITLVFIYTKP
jgi:hypothetical protein